MLHTKVFTSLCYMNLLVDFFISIPIQCWSFFVVKHLNIDNYCFGTTKPILSTIFSVVSAWSLILKWQYSWFWLIVMWAYCIKYTHISNPRSNLKEKIAKYFFFFRHDCLQLHILCVDGKRWSWQGYTTSILHFIRWHKWHCETVFGGFKEIFRKERVHFQAKVHQMHFLSSEFQKNTKLHAFIHAY